MKSDGKKLESLVAFIEKMHLPPGFVVSSNTRIFNDDGIQIAEFDVEIRGKIGTTAISWLIECRDRHGDGPAPASWIEQLVGRRTRFGFNKVTAVSTTGFSAGAMSFARSSGIELREVHSLDPSVFSDWLLINSINQVTRIADLKHANIILACDNPKNSLKSAMKIIKKSPGDARILLSSTTSERINLSEAFFRAVHTLEKPFDTVTPDKPCNIQITAEYRIEDHFLIETPYGPARVSQIDFIGELRVVEEQLPVRNAEEYRHAETNDTISQSVAFAPHSIFGMNLAVELYRIPESGKTHVALRRLPDKK